MRDATMWRERCLNVYVFISAVCCKFTVKYADNVYFNTGVTSAMDIRDRIEK